MLKSQGRKVILVRVETSPEDIHGMHAAEGILTTRGGMTSHAAVVARGMGKPCVSGAGALRVDYARRRMTAGGVTLKKGDIAHHRRLDRPGAGRQGADARAGARRRVRHADEMGRRRAQAQSARQCRHAGRRARRDQVRRRGHRAVPHRAHVLRRGSHPRRARDDPGRRRESAPRRARQAPADAARRFRRAVQDHGRAAGDHPAARSAAARVPAAQRGRDRRSRAGDGRRSEEARRSRARIARVQSDARLPRLPARDRLSGDRRDAGARHLRGRGRGRARDRQAGGAGNHGAADRQQGRARSGQGAHRRHGADGRRRDQKRSSNIRSAP